MCPIPIAYALHPLKSQLVYCIRQELTYRIVVSVLAAEVAGASEVDYGGLATDIVDVECLAYSIVIGRCHGIVGL
jgi:hypothetical protein